MGIDALDLAFRLEKRFGVVITRDEAYAALFHTVGHLQRNLVAKLNGKCRDVPRIEPLVMEIAEAVNRIAGRWKLTFSLDLNKRFPPATRAAKWEALETALRVSLPKLEESSDGEPARIPPQCDSLIALTYWIAEHHPERVEWVAVSGERKGKMAAYTWTEQEVWDILRECICDALGVKPEEVTPDARMVEDLGME